MKDIGFPKSLLGCQYEKKPNGIAMHQEEYINELLRRCDFQDCKSAPTPAVKRPEEASGSLPEKLIKSGYSTLSVVGALGWLARNSRPDINYAWAKAAQYVADADTTTQWRRLGRILRYLKGTKRLGVLWRYGHTQPLFGYTDADWGGTEHSKSQTGWIYFLAGAPLLWASVRQRCVSLSTAHAEIIAFAQGLKNGMGLSNLLKELKEPVPRPMTIHIDNQAAIALGETSIFTKGLRHVNLSYAFINDEVKKGEVKMKFVPSAEQLADFLTKPLKRIDHQRLTAQLLQQV